MVQTIKCPNCGANMQFDSDKQKMYCEFCQTELSVDDVNANEEKEQSKDNESQRNHDFDKDHDKADFKRYTCPSCGAELLTDEHTIATFCNFCGSPSLIEDRIEGELMPAQVIPFKISKEKAKDIYKAWTKKGLLTPKSFTKQNTIEKISGLYVPFWLYDYHARAQVRANCTRVRTEIHGDVQYIHTDNFNVSRDIDTEYVKVPADASTKMPDEVMDKLEPFHYGEMVGFTMPYLSGYSAEKYNYTSEEMAPRIEERIRDYASSAARDMIHGYTTVNVVDDNTWLNRKDAKYTLFPVWMLYYRFKEKDYVIAINGQTGKIVGNLPISGKRVATWFIGIAVVVFVILFGLGGLFG